MTIQHHRPKRIDLRNDTPAAVHAQIERARRALFDAALIAGHDPGRVEADVEAALAAAHLPTLSTPACTRSSGFLAERAARFTLELQSPRLSDRQPVQDAAGTLR